MGLGGALREAIGRRGPLVGSEFLLVSVDEKGLVGGRGAVGYVVDIIAVASVVDIFAVAERDFFLADTDERDGIRV